MKKDNQKASSNNSTASPQILQKKKTNPGNMKEEISLELAEMGNLNPKHEPMTKNQREKSESEKTYK